MMPEEGGCSIRIGKQCAFTDQQLNQAGIPVVPGEDVEISCSGEDSECVSSFGASNKICRCKNGYVSYPGGVDCRSSSSNSFDDSDNAENSVFWIDTKTKSTGRGRSMGKIKGKSASRHIIGSKNNTDDDTNEYFLFPEEIKTDLLQLMNLRGFAATGERRKEASSLYAKMEADNDKEEMVIRDIHLRRAATLKFGDHCDPAKQELLDHPPLAMQGADWVDPKPESITAWQTSILRDKRPLCNFNNALRCDATKRICQCEEGMLYQENKCHLMVGSNCGDDHQGTFVFDPLKNKKRFSAPSPPSCVSGAICESKPLLFTSQCWCPEGMTCGGESIASPPLSPPPPSLYADIRARFTLHLEDDCDPKAHLMLVNPSEKQVKDYKIRHPSIFATWKNS
ncbi:uncharacterized protein LOC118435424 isoform X2 [Folsomia candida]|uniref:uncharacterized protein LOC118435424 isoform X2 n=1 Tax=Folsomia candida TaxID=158441 RepID=UPI001605163F|nr:uncharacterized protein LOC118435424 isoform X2 [Folsomia candida]